MTRVTPFRVAAVLLLLFCAGHTAGGMLAQKSMGGASDVVFAQMKAVHFACNGSDCTWYGFWYGFGMTVSVFLLLSAVIAWQLDRVPPTAWKSTAVIAWALIAAHAANTVLSLKFFFMAPTIFSLCVTALLIWGALRAAERQEV